jgi:hypothetical protein
MRKVKLITETSYDVEPVITEKKSGNLYIAGIFSSAEIQNANGRKYPKDILSREIKNLIESKIANKTCVGEVNHPMTPEVNLDRAAILIEGLEWRGNDVYGKAKVLSTPMGNVVRALINDGVSVGISSRGVGSVSEETSCVNEDFQLITYDLVSSASNPGSYVKGIYEGKSFDVYSEEDMDKELQAKKYQEEWSKKIWQVLENI